MMYGKLDIDLPSPMEFHYIYDIKLNPFKPGFYSFSTWPDINGVESLRGNLGRTWDNF